ncbi:MAG TPA: glutamate mutase L [Aggregatilineales bacterium]|nr:glutamate mutase L [Aggregatilineales bacterium]
MSNKLDTQPTANTILAADFGSVNTRVVLFDRVDGQYRLLSRAQTLSTATPPVLDAGVALRRALAEITDLIGKPFFQGSGDLVVGGDGAVGVDVFVATASGGRPMRAVLVGLTSDVSLDSGKRALASAHVDLAETLSLVDVRGLEEQVNAILNSQPDMIFIVGGTDYGANDSLVSMLETVRLALRLSRARPVILYAGNIELKPIVEEMLGEESTVFTATNVRPTLAEEKLVGAELELALVYGAYKANNPGGFGDVQKISRLGIMPTGQSYSNLVQYLARINGHDVLCVDVGSSSVTISACIKNTPHLLIRPDLGLGHSAVTGLQAIGVKNVLRWLTYEATESDLVDYMWMKSLHPSTVPATVRDLEIEYAIAREFVRSAIHDSRRSWVGYPQTEALPGLGTIIGVGSLLTGSVDPGVSALLLLDAVQPAGLVQLKVDPYGVLAGLGSVAYLEPLAVVQVLESGGLLNLGTAICPTGKHDSGSAMEVRVRYVNGTTVKESVPAGSLKIIPLPVGQKANVSIRLARGLAINGRRTVNASLEGGVAGLICDGRGRPVPLPHSVKDRAAVLPGWLEAVKTV